MWDTTPTVAAILKEAESPPEKLMYGAELSLAAMILQHEAMLVMGRQVLKKAKACTCPKCAAGVEEVLDNVGAIERDRQMLRNAAQLVLAIGPWHNAPAKRLLRLAMDGLEHRANVDALEKAFEHNPHPEEGGKHQ